MKELNADTRAFVEQMGLMMDRTGGARTLGRLLGLLLVAEEPLSLGDMAALLQVSKASVSTNARRCEQVGLAHRVSKPGDRRDYYEISPGSFGRMLASRDAVIQEMIRLAELGLRAIEADNQLARARLEEMRDFYTFVGLEMKAVIEHWNARQAPDPSS